MKIESLAEAMHTAARRYCQERSTYWAKAYDQLAKAKKHYDPNSQRYSKRALNLFPRYQQLYAIQAEIERVVPSDLGEELEPARERLIALGEASRSYYLANTDHPVALHAAEEERTLFAEYLRTLDEETLWKVVPLPFRRALANDEAERWREQLEARFGKWYGGVPEKKVSIEYLTFHADKLAPPPHQALSPLLRKHQPSQHRLFELVEMSDHEPSYELDLELVSFAYWRGGEAFWCTSELDWMIYVSHESTLTVAGAWLVDAVRQAQPGWLEHRALFRAR